MFERNDRLLLDVGNTRVHWRLGRRQGDVTHSALLDADPLHWPWSGMGIREVLCVSVAAQDIRIALLEHFGRGRWRQFTGPVPELLPSVYAQGQLGHDRWLGMLGAASLNPDQTAEPVLVVDAGTALKVDLLTTAGHQGGWIMPGYQLWHTALYSGTQIRRSPAEQVLAELGTDTAAAMGNAWLLAVKGLIDQVMSRYPRLKLLLAGGDADRLSAQWPSAELRRDVVLVGLDRWGQWVEQSNPESRLSGGHEEN